MLEFLECRDKAFGHRDMPLPAAFRKRLLTVPIRPRYRNLLVSGLKSWLIQHGGLALQIRSGFFHELSFVASFFDVQRRIYPSLQLEEAHRQGLLGVTTVPFAVFDDTGNALSILNATEMDVVIAHQTYRTVQIGTVGTLPECRGRGLAALLLESVLEHYAPRTDFQLLFANESVVNFYPKFGFVPVQQTRFERIPSTDRPLDLSRLDLACSADLGLLRSLIHDRESVSHVIDVSNCGWLTEFYCTMQLADCLWVDQCQSTILVARVDGQVLTLYDLITREISIAFFEALSWPGISRIRLGFTPDRFQGGFETQPHEEPMLVRGHFPFGIGPFTFPVLAQT